MVSKTSFANATEVNTGYSAVGSVSGLGPEGRVFESHYPDKAKACPQNAAGFFLSLKR